MHSAAVSKASATPKARTSGSSFSTRRNHPIPPPTSQNTRFGFPNTEEGADRAAQLAAELVRTGVDIIVAHFTPAIRAAIGATRTIPIVMAPAGAPVQLGFIASLAHPGGNVTGLSGIDAEIGGKRLQLLQQLIPGLNCGAVLSANPA